jgi:DNA-directed RNA polymerase specialized sigma24 family protein
VTLHAAASDDSADRQRFRALWADHYADVLAFVLRRVSDREVAADVVAETYLVAWRRRNDLPAESIAVRRSWQGSHTSRRPSKRSPTSA